MTEKSRTEYSARNTTIAMISRIIAILMGYLTRIVLTHTLSESYVGINGLFTDILNVLALSELGVGTALTYALYKPIAVRDTEKQKSIMRLFKWLYRAVAMIIAVGGLCVLPFLPYLVNDSGDVKHVTLIYLLYLLNSVVSYLMIYKKTLIDAHQQSYIGVLYHTVFLVIQYVLQIVLLLWTRNFVLYLLVYLLCTVLNNLSVAKKADKMYPYLKDRDVQPIPREEKQGIVRNMKAMLMHKIGNVIVNNTDNLLLSSMVGLASAGKYSNYYLIIGSVRQVLDQAFQGITASVGNLGVTADKKRFRKIFEASFFIGQWIYGFAGICLYQLLNYVIGFSFGENYRFGAPLVLVLCVNFFVTGMRQATLVFRDSLGLFWYDRYKSLAEAAINLIVSIVLTLRFGAVGVFLGTFVSTMTTSFWIEPYVLYKKKLEAPVSAYFLRYVLYSAAVLGAGALTHLACEAVGGDGFGGFLADLAICAVLPNVVFLICYFRTKEFRFVIAKAWELVGRKLRRPEKQFHKNEEEDGGSGILTDGDKNVLKALKAALAGGETELNLSGAEWDEVFSIAERHAVLPLLYDVAEKQNLDEERMNRVALASRRCVLQSYRLNFCTLKMITTLSEKGIGAAVLKGASAAQYYPVPELRKSGDIDILILDESELDAAREALEAVGCRTESEQHSLHHLVLRYEAGIEIELHTMLAEPFDNDAVNDYLAECIRGIAKNLSEREIMELKLPILSDGYLAFGLLLHMLQHFLRSGFGLKLLCDWVCFWNRDVDKNEAETYIRLIDDSGLRGFSEMITSLCVYYLGLDGERAAQIHKNPIDRADAESFIADIIEAEEFGKSARDRMVAMRGTSLGDYFREFHHAMRLNFPRAGKVVLLWPALWIITLTRFLRNNRRIRGVTTKAVLKKAGERSRKMKKLGLFERK